MEQRITIGIDLAKSVFQLHGVDAEGAVVFSRQVRRSQMLDFFRNLPPCLVGKFQFATTRFFGGRSQ